MQVICHRVEYKPRAHGMAVVDSGKIRGEPMCYRRNIKRGVFASLHKSQCNYLYLKNG